MPHLKKLVMHGFKSFPHETEILLDRSMNCIVGPNGSGKSAKWDTGILLASGEIKPIGELVEESLKKAEIIRQLDDGELTYENPLNISVLSLDTKSMKIKEGNVKAFIKRDGEPNLFTIKTKIGKEVTTTSCHPILVYKNEEIVSEIVENLKVGDFIATPNILNLNDKEDKIEINGLNQNISKVKLARFLGYVVGDGCIIPNARIDFVNADKEILEDYRGIVKDFGLKIGEGNKKGSLAKNIYLYSRNLSNGLIDFFENNYKKEGKHIPSKILFSKKEILSNFLGALFDCDASVRKDNPTFEYCTMSSKLAEGVIAGLLRFGIVARKLRKLKYAANTKDKIKREYFFVLVEGKEKITKLHNQIILKCEHKRALLQKWAKNNVIPNTNNDVLPQEVNFQVRELVNLLGIKIKKIRNQYPLLAAYIENRCNPSKEGIKRVLSLFRSRLSNMISSYNNLISDQTKLIEFMDLMNLSSRSTSESIGLYKNTIRGVWGRQLFKARPENVEKFRGFLEGVYFSRLTRINKLINLLENLAESEIFWDKVLEIKKVKGEPYVYDLEIEDNHNFIANNIFVHNSNITDAICFVLGRLSVKSMRAAKAANMIFAGTKIHKPANEASVSIVFDNSDKMFSIPDKEVVIKRIVRRNGQSIYKINNSTKTRQEVLELLAQAGIDPYGFNIVLQGEIDSFVKMHAEERRRIIEEVAGISVYETRKQKSLKELEKTEEKLKEVSAVLRERTIYLKNLENERQQALKFKKLEETVKKCKASILKKKLDDKEREKEMVAEEIHKKNSELDKIKINISKVDEEIKNLNSRIEEINNKIQKSSGLEQEPLHNEIAELKADIAGLSVRKENFQNQIETVSRRKEELEKNIKNSEQEIAEMRKSKGKSRKQEFEKKKAILDDIEDKRRKFYSYKSSLSLLQERIGDKRKELQRLEQESSFIFEKIKETELSLETKEHLEKNRELVLSLKKSLEEKKKEQKDNEKIMLEIEKEIAVLNKQIEELNSIKAQVSKIDICPLCKTKITSGHISHIEQDSNEKISSLKNNIEAAEKKKNGAWELKESLIINLKEILNETEKRERDIVKLDSINEKKQYLRRLEQEKTELLPKLEDIENEKNKLEKAISQFKNIEESYDSLSLEVQELARHEEVNAGMEITLKERELERMKLIIRQSLREKEELEEEISTISNDLDEKESLVEEKEKQEQMLQIKFKKMFEEKTKIQDKIRLFESDSLRKQNDSRLIEDTINNLKIKMAELNAQHEGLGLEFKEFESIEIIKLPIPQLQEKLEKTQQILNTIGTVNLRALEVYDDIKKEYDAIAEKVTQLEKEKQEILKIVEEIDNKKKKTFNKTLTEINSLFSRNFSQLSTKGYAFLEPENKEDIFSAGLDIIIKVGKGKYFDVTSLSGGEQTLIALSLIFAIQEYNPYHFYIFDEIDAALDKRNSERLAGLLKKHMKSGQYLIITHNDALISESSTLYGVSMQEGISKVLSLQI